jgi:YHS domain-containing protein
MPPAIYVSADAVIDSGIKNTVYVDIGNGVLEPREVETGWKLGRWVEILRGLMPGDKVVVSGNFLIDSESRMKTAASGSSVQMHKDIVCGMNVSEQIATEAGRLVEHDGQSYYFCSPACKVKFLAEIDKYVGSSSTEAKQRNHASMTPRIQDPVCGMAVDALKSEYSGWFFKLGDETYHFCSQQCMGDFMKNPGKYTGQKHSAMKGPAHTGQPQKGQPDSAVSMKSEHATQKSAQGDANQHKSTGKAVDKKSHTTSGVIDWNGPESEQSSGSPRDWSGWGAFPGAEYLGQKQKKDQKSPSHNFDTLDSNKAPSSMENR